MIDEYRLYREMRDDLYVPDRPISSFAVHLDFILCHMVGIRMNGWRKRVTHTCRPCMLRVKAKRMIAQACGGATVTGHTERLLRLVLVELLVLLVLVLLLLDAAVKIHGNVVVLLAPSRIMDMHRLYINE